MPPKPSSIALYQRILTAYQTEKRLSHLVRSLKVAQKTIKRALRWGGVEQVDVVKAGLWTRKHPINHGYFASIETAEQAYYLGLLYADGTVIVRADGTRGFAINLTETDAYILDPLNRHVRYGKPLLRYVYKDGRGRPALYMSAWSKQLADDLIRLGCTPRKSLTLQFPTEEQVPTRLMGAFLRGYFDGDGHAGFYSPRLDVRLTSSHSFCAGVRDYLRERHGIDATVSDRGSFADVVLTQKLGKMRFYRLLYEDASFPFCLRRKKEAFEGVFDHLEARAKERKLSVNQLATLAVGRVQYTTEVKDSFTVPHWHPSL